MSYQGPKVTVTQNFDLSAPDVAVEDLPSAIAASAYYVGDKENQGPMDGVGDDIKLYPYANTVNSVEDWPREIYEFYPIRVYVDGDTERVDITDDVSILDNGVEFDEFERYTTVSETEPQAAKALFFKRDTPAVQVGQILVGDATVIVLDAPMSQSEQDNIVVGMPVGLRVTGDPVTDYVVTAYVDTVIDSTQIKLQAPAAVASYDAVIVGTYQVNQKGGPVVLTSTSAPCVLYDLQANFSADGVAIGDIVCFKSPQNPAGADILIEASVVQVLSKNMLIYNTITQGTGRTDYDIKTVKRWDQTVGIGTNVTSYSIKRMVSFSANYGYKEPAGTIVVGTVSGGGLSFVLDVAPINAAGLDTPIEGDVVAFTTAVTALTARLADGPNLRKFYIQSISKAGDDWTITLDAPGETSIDVTPVALTAGQHVTMWKPTVSHDILMDYRAWNPTEAEVVQRISGVEKIKDLWADGGDIADENELAFMAQAQHVASGAGVNYAINVNPADQLSSYANALDKLKMVDCYSHAFGTTDPGVNALVSPYVNDQSDPERGHERIGTLTYSEWDVYLKRVGESSAVAADGQVTITAPIPLPVGVRRGDAIYLIDTTTREIVANGLLTATPSALDTILFTDIAGFTSASTLDYRIQATDPNDQAIAIAALSIANRRVKILWPGWFVAQGSTTDFKTFPPYYISATRSGLDSGVVPSQSFTNFPYSVTGLSNISLNTNLGLFDSDALDIIGGGGIDVQIQEVASSQTIKSRHDLTTDMTGIETREWSITKQVDVAAKTYRSAIKPYIGRNITPKFLQFLGEVCSVVATTIIKGKIVRGASTATVVQDPLVVDKVNITVAISIFVAGNRIDITLNVLSR